MRTLFNIFSVTQTPSFALKGILICVLTLSPLWQAEAGLWSSVLGSEANAQNSTINSVDLSKNSQTLPILQADVPIFDITEDKKGSKVSPDAKGDIVEDMALLPTTGPSSIFGGHEEEDFSLEDTSIYVVHKGDTVQIVADMFGVSVDTILSTNGMKKGDSLKEGDVLLILPFSGVEHTVKSGETLNGIANKYKVEVEDILYANDLQGDIKLVIGDKLMIPGASMPSILSETKSKVPTIVVKGRSLVPSVVGYFKNPVPGARKSRGVKPGHKGVDFAASTGTPIYASASGTVLIARNGFNGGFGIYVVIQHPNGVKTLYAHMSKLDTTAGVKVAQGQVIGYVGSTGKSTGPHTHFETIGAKNPF